MIPKELEWRKISDHPNKFFSGDNYLLAIKIKNNHNQIYEWEFVSIFIDCDEEYFELKQKNNGVKVTLIGIFSILIIISNIEAVE